MMGGLGGLFLLIVYVVIGPGGLVYRSVFLSLHATGVLRMIPSAQETARRCLPWHIGITALPIALFYYFKHLG
jgi:hypothetical protein